MAGWLDGRLCEKGKRIAYDTWYRCAIVETGKIP